MARSVWAGSLSFGLVSIPVALYPATSPKDVRFHLFDRQGRRVRNRRVTGEARSSDAFDRDAEPVDGMPGRRADGRAAVSEPTSPPSERPDGGGGESASDGAGLEYHELMRGYEVEPGRFAMLEHEEIERARPERSTTIELEDFVELEHIDPVFFDKAYYLAPRRDAAKPYRLLLRTLDRTHRVGIGRFVLRTKPHLVAVRSTDDALVLQTLFFGDEVRAPSEVVHASDEEVSERELRVAEQLVGMFAASWDPERYANEYRDELLRIIAEKAPVASGEGPERTPEHMRAPGAPHVEELMEALKRSVEEAKAGRGEKGRRRRAG